MAHEISYEVAALDQHQVFPTVSKNNNMACWYTSAQMLVSYRSVGASIISAANIQTLARLVKNKGLGATEDLNLAYEFGLEHSKTGVLFNKKDAQAWYTNLSRLGPLMVSYPTHVVLVRGLENRGGQWLLVINDPWGGKVERYEIAEFNKKVEWSFPIHYRRKAQRAPSVLLQPVRDPSKINY